MMLLGEHGDGSEGESLPSSSSSLMQVSLRRTKSMLGEVKEVECLASLACGARHWFTPLNLRPLREKQACVVVILVVLFLKYLWGMVIVIAHDRVLDQGK